jgi:diguanylate cyclase (GGDEF)-like protein
MELDVRSVMLVGVLLSVLTVILLAQAARAFPVARRRHLRIWTGGIVLQPIAWILLASRPAVPDLVAIPLAHGLLLMGLAEMSRAMRGFRGLPERAWLWWGIALAGTLLLVPLTGVWPNYGHRVIVSAIAGMLLQSGLVWALAPTFRGGGFSAARFTGLFALVGVLTAAWRLAEHVVRPRLEGGLLDAGPSDVFVALYACVGVMYLSLGFVLMHTERAYDDLRWLATVDVLTGTLARSGLGEHGSRLLSEARRHRRSLSVLLIDLDRFKGVNDSLGHAVGDQLLQHFAQCARQVLRGEDLLGRLGGDEFVALLPSTDAAGACVVAARLRDALANNPLRVGAAVVLAPLSIGVAEAAADGPDAGGFDALLQRADAAMYRAKRAGGDRVDIAPPVTIGG